MKDQVLHVELGEKSYPIAIGSGVLNRLSDFAAYFGKGPLAVVSNTRVAPLHLPALRERLQRLGHGVIEIILPDGEAHKNWSNLNLIFDALLAAHCERGTPLLALGGGVIGDMGGFAAACYQRGMPFIQIPTTLLAQVDSSVGGKTAINHPLGKNMIGTFYQPQLVLIDIDVVHTLPDREYFSGLAEVIKYGLIRDLPFLEWLEAHMDALCARDAVALTYAIYRSCQNKAEVVARDEKEQGERAFLNFGHTFAHAIETGLGYGAWLHGEAVAAGMMMAADLSARMGWLTAQEVQRVERLLQRAHLPVRGPSAADGMTIERYLALMQHDKKVKEGKLCLVLLTALGKACVSDAASPEKVQQAIFAWQ